MLDEARVPHFCFMKVADTQYPVLDVIRNRWSARSFANEPLSEEEVHTLIEAASWAPSAMNEQPWRFVYAHRSHTPAFETLARLLFPGNHAWAAQAALLVVVLGKQTYTRNDKPNRNTAHDVGMATQNLLLQATALDIYGHVMEGFDRSAAREALRLSEDYEPVTMLALGRLDNPERLEEPYRSREIAQRTRKQVTQLIFQPGDKID